MTVATAVREREQQGETMGWHVTACAHPYPAAHLSWGSSTREASSPFTRPMAAMVVPLCRLRWFVGGAPAHGSSAASVVVAWPSSCELATAAKQLPVRVDAHEQLVVGLHLVIVTLVGEPAGDVDRAAVNSAPWARPN